VPVRRSSKNGRPTKRTEAVLKPLFKAIRIGVPYKLACMAAGISYDCFNHWRKQDPEFDRQVEQAAAEPAVKLFNTIRQQAPQAWQAGAWSLERRYPEMFAKPEAQLSIVATAQAAALGPSNVVVVGPERAKILATRHEQLRAKSIALLNAREAPAGNGQGSAQQLPAASEPESSQLPTVPTDSAPAQEPLPIKPSSWWRPFIFGGAVIPKAEAILAVRMILNELRMTVDERALDFGTDNVAKSVFSKVLEQLSGSDLGWRTMVQIYERQQARERIWADH
jgi:transposase